MSDEKTAKDEDEEYVSFLAYDCASDKRTDIHSTRFHMVWMYYHGEKFVGLYNHRPNKDEPTRRGFLWRGIDEDVKAKIIWDLSLDPEDFEMLSARDLDSEMLNAMSNNVLEVIDERGGFKPAS